MLELVAVDGLPVTEAAAALRIRPGTARVRLHRARRALKEALGLPGATSATPEPTKESKSLGQPDPGHAATNKESKS